MATTTPADDILRVRRRLQDVDLDDHLLSDGDLDDLVQAAVERYSQLVPGLATVNITGTGSRYYDRDLLTGFVADWSRIEQVEFPARDVESSSVPQFLDIGSDIRWYRDGTDVYLYLPSHQPSASQTLRVTFTVPRSLSDASDTVVSEHKDAVLALAAAYGCMALATKMASAHEPLVSADVASFSAGQQRFLDQARAWERFFNERVGVGAKEEIKAAGVRRDWDLRGYKKGVRPRLTHAGRW